MDNCVRIGRLGILLHPAKAEARALAGEVCDACRHVGMEAVAIGAATQLDEQIDAVAVLGGDGTILRALRLMLSTSSTSPSPTCVRHLKLFAL